MKSELDNKMDKSKECLKHNEGHTHLQWLTAILVNTTLVTYGLQTSWVSPMTKRLQSDLSPTGRPLTDSEISWMAGTLCLFATIGVSVYAYIADTYGCKLALIAIAVPQAICWSIKLFSSSTAVLIIARALAGLAAGGCFNVVPIYVKEISQDSIRGLLGSLLILFQNIGMLGIFALGAYFDYFTVLWIVIGIPFVTLPLILRAPESPAYLIKIGKLEEAASVVGYLRGLDPSDKMVQKEIDSMKSEDLYFKSILNVSFLSIFKETAWRRGFILTFSIMTVHALNGSITITTYATAILSSSGVTVSPELQSLSFPIVMILSSFVSMSFIERFGRKPVLVAALILISASMASVGSIVLVQHQGGSVPAWLTVVSMIGAVAGYAGGVSPVPYVMMAEMFNFQIRAKFLGCIVTYAWFMSFIQLITFGPISNALGQYTAFYVFGAINFLGIFVALVLPETRGKSVEQIEDELRLRWFSF